MKTKLKNNCGFGLIEVLVGSALILIAFLSVLGAYSLYLKTALANMKIVQANLLAEEGLEIMYILREESWTNNIASLTSGSEYRFLYSGGDWDTTTANAFIDGVFDRKVVISDVYRDDTAKDIVTSGGSLDQGTKLVTVSVSWLRGNATTTKSMSAYVGNLYAN